MASRPPVVKPVEYGSGTSFWVEYPSGLVDLTRSCHLPSGTAAGEETPPTLSPGQVEFAVNEGRVTRVSAVHTALVVIDMQNYFLHPDLRKHPSGLNCVQPLLDVIPVLRTNGIKIIWLNWGLTEHELKTIPPSLVRGFTKGDNKGFGSQLPGDFGRLLMRGELNSALYGPLQAQYESGLAQGTDIWVHKNRMSGIWGHQSALDLYLQEQGLTTLLFAGVNADQCVLGTLVDAYYKGYDCIIVGDATATTSPDGGLENVLYNAGRSYGFLTASKDIMALQSAL